jgi:GrpB-like predicted nucleotidyltransferase (UPF0157 family)
VRSPSLGRVETGDRDRYLDQVLIGGRERRAIVIVDYDPAWARRFDSERQRISAALGGTAPTIEHIGSTSVPGLAAKPIVDILVPVDDVEDEAAYRPALEDAGYVLRVREPGHRMFRTPELDVHVHLWPAGSEDVERHLLFRDWLRRDERDRRDYESLKRLLAQRDYGDTNEYADAKTELIVEIMERARAWAGEVDDRGSPRSHHPRCQRS